MSDKPEPAFPHPYRDVPGMTLHDAAVLAALPHCIASIFGEYEWEKASVMAAFRVADAFMAERAERAKGAKP